MSGPIIRSGPSPDFSKNWEQVFGNKKGAKKAAKSAKKAAAAPRSAKKAAPAKKKKGKK
jgi:hypothetical protein